jgi:hypothetical protein
MLAHDKMLDHKSLSSSLSKETAEAFECLSMVRWFCEEQLPLGQPSRGVQSSNADPEQESESRAVPVMRPGAPSARKVERWLW